MQMYLLLLAVWHLICCVGALLFMYVVNKESLSPEAVTDIFKMSA